MKFEMPEIEVYSFDLNQNIAALKGDEVVISKGEISNAF